jgi:hypothetical protein
MKKFVTAVPKCLNSVKFQNIYQLCCHATNSLVEILLNTGNLSESSHQISLCNETQQVVTLPDAQRLSEKHNTLTDNLENIS